MQASVGFPHSDIPGSPVAWDLSEAYRTLQRPSSSNNVEASTVRPYAHYENTKLCFRLFCTLHMILYLVNCQERTNLPEPPILSYRLYRLYFSMICQKVSKKPPSSGQTHQKNEVSGAWNSWICRRLKHLEKTLVSAMSPLL